MNIDQKIAEKVMGWRLVNYETCEPARTPADYADAAQNDGWTWEGRQVDDREAWTWQPSTDIACAFEIVDHLLTTEDRDFQLYVSGALIRADLGLSKGWDQNTRRDGDTVPGAIVNAALAAFNLEGES